MKKFIVLLFLAALAVAAVSGVYRHYVRVEPFQARLPIDELRPHVDLVTIRGEAILLFESSATSDVYLQRRGHDAVKLAPSDVAPLLMHLFSSRKMTYGIRHTCRFKPDWFLTHPAY